MRHYEVVLLVHPDQSNQVADMVTRYRTLVEENGGQNHRLEGLGSPSVGLPNQQNPQSALCATKH